MKSPWLILAGALMASLISLPAMAQTAQDRELAQKICADQTGSAFKICVNQQLRNFDCTNAGNRQQCEARKKVYQECQGHPAGPAFRQCVQQKMPPADCSKASDQARCDFHQRVREACKDKLGQEHMACLRAQFSGK